MFNFNPYGAAEYGMVAELHRQVQRESEEKVAEPRPRLITLPFRLLINLWQSRPQFPARLSGLADEACDPVETC